MDNNFTRLSSERGPEGAEPLGWQGGYDWEVYLETKTMRANLYDEDVLIAVVEATSKRRLAKGMRREQKRLGIKKATVL